MSSFTQKEIQSFLEEATTSKARMSKYTDLLGIGKLSKSKSRSGPQVYEDKVGGFYKAMKEISRELSKNYDSLSQLQEQVKSQRGFTESLIDNTIEEYGSHIWNDGESGFVTVIDDEHTKVKPYPRHLIYNNGSDRVMIRTYAYCFALQSICQALKRSGAQSHDGTIISRELPHTTPRGSRARKQTDATAPVPDPVSVEPRRAVITTSVSPTTSESRILQDTCEYQVPVAQMISDANTENASSSSVMPQPTIGGASFMTRNNFTATKSHGQPDEKLDSNSPHMKGYHNNQAFIKNSRQREETDEDLPFRKRRIGQGAAADTNLQSLQRSEFTGRSVRPKRGLTINISPSISPNETPEITNNSADQRLGETPSNRTTRHYASGMSPVLDQSFVDIDMDIDSQDDEIAITTLLIGNTNPGGNMPNCSVQKADSVVVPSPTREEQDQDNESNQIVRLNVQNAKVTRQRKLCRTRLASKLSTLFETSSEQPKVLGEVVELIRETRILDTLLTQSGSGGRNGPYQSMLDQWLELVEIYLRFRKDTNSNDQRTWLAHRNSLEPSVRRRELRLYEGARVEVQEWEVKHENHETDEWPKCVTIALLEMADWGLEFTTKDREEKIEEFVKFNSLVLDQFR